MRKFPFPGFCLMPGNWKKKTFVPVDHFPDFNLESATIIIKNMFIMKNLTDFRQTVETSVDPPLVIQMVRRDPVRVLDDRLVTRVGQNKMKTGETHSRQCFVQGMQMK